MKIEIIDDDWNKDRYRVQTTITNQSNGNSRSQNSDLLMLSDLKNLRDLLNLKIQEIEDV